MVKLPVGVKNPRTTEKFIGSRHRIFESKVYSLEIIHCKLSCNTVYYLRGRLATAPHYKMTLENTIDK